MREACQVGKVAEAGVVEDESRFRTCRAGSVASSAGRPAKRMQPVRLSAVSWLHPARCCQPPARLVQYMSSRNRRRGTRDNAAGSSVRL